MSESSMIAPLQGGQRGLPRLQHDRALPEDHDDPRTRGERAGGGRARAAPGERQVVIGPRMHRRRAQAPHLEYRSRPDGGGTAADHRPRLFAAQAEQPRPEFRHGGEGRLASLEPAWAALPVLRGRPGERSRHGLSRRHLWATARRPRARRRCIDATEACIAEGDYDLSLDWTEVLLGGNSAEPGYSRGPLWRARSRSRPTGWAPIWRTASSACRLT